MTRQTWWDARRLGRIRHGIMMGMYHQSAGYDDRYRALLLKQTFDSPLTGYERGLLHGYTRPQRIFRPVTP